MPSRRELLAATGGLAASAAAGCSGVLGSDRSRHFLDVMNGTDESHAFAVTVFDADDAVIFEHEYALDANAGDENRVVEGQPARVAMSIDGGGRNVIPWEPRSDSSFVTNRPDGCPDGTTTSLTLWYGKTTDAALEPFFGCETAD